MKRIVPLKKSGINKHDINEIISLLENPTRRKILRLLAMEMHYTLQIAQELGISQQAVGKHIKILEDHGLVRSFEVPSDRGGPPRKSYIPTQGFSIRIDMGPGLFQTYFFERDPIDREIPDKQKTPQHKGRFIRMGRKDPSISAHSDGKEPRHEKLTRGVKTLQRLFKELQEINKDLEEMERRRISMLDRREKLLQEGKRIVGDLIPDYMERRLVYYLLDKGPCPMEDVSEIFDERIKRLKELQKKIEQRYGLQWLFQI